MKDKKIIHIHLMDEILDEMHFQGSFNEVIENLSKEKEKYEAKCSDGMWCKIDIEYSHSTYYMLVKYFRYETDEEYEKRMTKKEKRQQKIKENDLALLKKLQQKYPDGEKS